MPVYHPHAPRTGDHTPHSRLWISGASLRPAVTGAPASVLDIAPTVLAALDVALPDWLDGNPLVVSDAVTNARRVDALAIATD